jgi:hypothetical protein
MPKAEGLHDKLGGYYEVGYAQHKISGEGSVSRLLFEGIRMEAYCKKNSASTNCAVHQSLFIISRAVHGKRSLCIVEARADSRKVGEQATLC